MFPCVGGNQLPASFSRKTCMSIHSSAGSLLSFEASKAFPLSQIRSMSN